MPASRRSAFIALTTAISVTVALGACSDSGTPDPGSSGAPITIDYESVVWQPGAVAANRAIVDAWNKENPTIQVNLIEGAWKGMKDKLLTGFEAGQAPDVFQYDSKRIGDFAQLGHILDLDPYISEEKRSDILDGAWQTVQYEGLDGTYAIPFLQEADIVFANATILKDAGIELPTIDNPWTWEDYRTVAQKLTVDDDGDGKPEVWGAGIPLATPADRMLRLSFANDGLYFTTNTDGNDEVVFGEAEAKVPENIHAMLYDDKTVDLGNIGVETEELLPSFFAGTTATMLGEAWLRDQFIESAPDGFEWVALPPVFAGSFKQPSDSQSLAVSQITEHPKEAAAFVSYFTDAENQIQMAQGDAMLATSKTALASPELTTPENGWDVISPLAQYKAEAPYQTVEGFGEWADVVGDAAFDRYFRGEIDVDELGRILVEDGNEVLEGYNK